jgi:hypothetical protein
VSGRAFGLAAAALVGVGLLRLVWAQAAFAPTVDQHIHLLTGLEWWDRGTYEFEPLHPPLSRILIGALPYGLAGLRLPEEVRAFRCPTFARSLERLRPNGKRFSCMSRLPLDVDAFFTARPDYQRLFRLAGLGTLPLFVLAAAATALWALALHDRPTALLAVLLFTTLPPVLGHAGVATTDMALVGTLPLALLAFRWLLRSPSRLSAAACGAALGLALLSKFSALLFLPPGLLVVAVAHWRTRRAEPPPAPAWRAWALMALSAALVVWAGYRFRVAAPADLVPGWREGRLAAAPLVPAPELVAGVHDALKKESAGHAYFVLGRALDRQGVWYFFPVALLFKTPLPFLAALGLGAAGALRRPRSPEAALPPLLALALLAAAMTVDVNVGLRHALVLYPFLCLTAALALRRALAASRAWSALATLLLAAHLAAGIDAHPDYLAYFNALARGRPEEVLVDSDLDWGQDVKRLGAAARARGIREITVCRAGPVPLAVYAPEVREVRACPDRPVPGWFAVGLSDLKAFHRDALAWLGRERPVALIGSSIRLYYVAPRPGTP